MKILVAGKVDGNWKRLGVARARVDGTITFLPEGFRGQMTGWVARTGAKELADQAVAWVDHKIHGREYRTSRA